MRDRSIIRLVVYSDILVMEIIFVFTVCQRTVACYAEPHSCYSRIVCPSVCHTLALC